MPRGSTDEEFMECHRFHNACELPTYSTSSVTVSAITSVVSFELAASSFLSFDGRLYGIDRDTGKFVEEGLHPTVRKALILGLFHDGSVCVDGCNQLLFGDLLLHRVVSFGRRNVAVIAWFWGVIGRGFRRAFALGLFVLAFA